MNLVRVRTAVSVALTVVLVCASGLSPAICHTHGGEETNHGKLARTTHGQSLQPLSTHWHVSWFGFELTLATDADTPADEQSRVEAGLVAVSQHGQSARFAVANFLTDWIAPVAAANSVTLLPSLSVAPTRNEHDFLSIAPSRSAVLRI